MLEPVFHDLIIADQECFASEEGWEALLHLIPDKDIVDNLREKWEASPGRSSEDKWQDLEDEVAKKSSKGKSNYFQVRKRVIPPRLSPLNVRTVVGYHDSRQGGYRTTIHIS